MQNIHLLGQLGEALMNRFPQADKLPRSKPKQRASNPLRGYYNKYSHQLTEYVTEQNGRRLSQKMTKLNKAIS